MMNQMPGFRFCPTDEELINHYLRLKLLGHDDLVNNRIATIDVQMCKPWDLPKYSVVKSNDQEWYFFTPRITKYQNSDRANRTTKTGYWKVTSADRIIKNHNGEQIGTKKNLVFYKGRHPKGVKTHFVVHEYIASFDLPNKSGDFVVWKLKNNSDDFVSSYGEGETSSPGGFGGQPQNRNNIIRQPQNQNNMMLEDIDPQVQASLRSFQDWSETDYNLNAALQYSQYNSNYGCFNTWG